VRLEAIRWHLGTHNNTLREGPVLLGLWTGFLTVRAFQAEEAIRVTIEYCRKGKPPDRDEIRTIPEEAKDMLLQFETLAVRDDLLYRRFVHRDGSTKHLQLILPTKMRREYSVRNSPPRSLTDCMRDWG